MVCTRTSGEWGWFVIIQKTRPLIGMPNPEEELRLLEEQANATYGVYKDKLDTKARLLEENEAIKEEKKALMAQLEKEQGNLSVYHEKQAQATAQIADYENQLVAAQDKLAQLEQEKTNRDHTIKSLNDEIANQDEVINKLNKEK